jgi:ribonucleoside-diphosphate reductase beta chain
MTKEISTEPILIENPNRFCIFPIEHKDLWQLYKTAEASFWTAEELDFADDKFDELNENEQYFIKHVLGFFANSDGIVNENIGINFLNAVQYPEARLFYGFQIMIEGIHGEVYSLLIDSYIKNEEEKQKLFRATQNFPAIKKKADWALKWITNGTFVEQLIAFAVVEGVYFSGSFCAIYWLKEQGKMRGLCSANELISRDEGMHCSYATYLYKNHIVNKLEASVVKDIILEALEIEKEFILEALPVSLLGMNSTLMSQYLEYVADQLLVDLGLPKYFNSTQPFEFMTNIALTTKSNFFEMRVNEYAKAGVKTQEVKKISFDEKF